MRAIAFDTLEFVEQLKAVGVPDEQAKGHVKAFATAMRQVEESRVDERATKRGMTELKVELKRDIKELEILMVIKMGAMILGGVVLVMMVNFLWPVPVQYVSDSFF